MQRLLYNTSAIVFFITIFTSLALVIRLPSFDLFASTDQSVWVRTFDSSFQLIADYTTRDGVQIEFEQNAIITKEAAKIFGTTAEDVSLNIEENTIEIESDQSIFFVQAFEEVSVILDNDTITFFPNTFGFIFLPTKEVYVFEGNAQANTFRLSANEYFNLNTSSVEPIDRETFFRQPNLVNILTLLEENSTLPQFFQDVVAPDLVVLSSGLTNQQEYQLNGSVNEESSIFINDVLVALDSETLKFEYDVILEAGTNMFDIEAVDASGNITVLSFTVTYTPPIIPSFPVSFTY